MPCNPALVNSMIGSCRTQLGHSTRLHPLLGWLSAGMVFDERFRPIDDPRVILRSCAYGARAAEAHADAPAAHSSGVLSDAGPMRPGLYGYILMLAGWWAAGIPGTPSTASHPQLAGCR